MRKAAGLLCAVSLLIPVAVWAAAPAGSAAKGPTCKTLTASGTFKPPLPKIGNNTIVTSTVSSSGKIGGCTGIPGVTSATTTYTYTYKGNCTTFAGIKPGGVTTPRGGTIKWNKGAPSSIGITTKLLSKVGVQPLLLQLTTKISKGQFAGTTSVAKVKGSSSNKTACTGSALASFTLTGAGSSTFK